MTELTKREIILVNWLRKQGTASVSEVAKRFGITNNTAGVHLQNVRSKGHIKNTGLGRYSVWQVVEKEDFKSRPANIEQVASIWHYAKRHGESKR